MPREEALKVLDKKPTGAFVIFRAAKKHRFTLAYKYTNKILEEEVVHTPPGAMFQEGV